MAVTRRHRSWRGWGERGFDPPCCLHSRDIGAYLLITPPEDDAEIITHENAGSADAAVSLTR